MVPTPYPILSLKNYDTILHERTRRLISCITLRQDSKSVVCLNDALQHWSYDVMVRIICVILGQSSSNMFLKGSMVFGPSSGLELMENGDKEGFVANGQLATAAYEM